ncbi:hypothetical protein ACET3X_002133 [Alternaria dauci]|uniref:RING-type domain-containing protein n=1 Tax=Alternaria dauci TaxID=48095 RepID=A0ABR3URK6_9PLEO
MSTYDDDDDNDNAPPDDFARYDFGHLFGDIDHQDEQLNAPPVPYTTAFFDHILHPAALDHGRYSPFAWRPYSPFPADTFMPPSTRPRPDRLANGYVDLTSAPDSPPPRPTTAVRRRESPTPGPSAKRQKRSDGTAAGLEDEGKHAEKVDEVDLTTEQKSPLQQALQKQQVDAVETQTKPEETVTTFNSFNCVICMDNPTDLTATACGHLFCHTCLMEALIAGENRTGPHETKRSQCPVCRKNISRTKATDVIPLLLKKGLTTQPRKKVVAAAAPAPKPTRNLSRRVTEPTRKTRRVEWDDDNVEWV